MYVSIIKIPNQLYYKQRYSGLSYYIKQIYNTKLNYLHIAIFIIL